MMTMMEMLAENGSHVLFIESVVQPSKAYVRDARCCHGHLIQTMKRNKGG